MRTRRIIPAALSIIHIPYLVGCLAAGTDFSSLKKETYHGNEEDDLLALGGAAEPEWGAAGLQLRTTKRRTICRWPWATRGPMSIRFMTSTGVMAKKVNGRRIWTQVHDPRRFTITVERTEVIDGKTYYLLSDMPANWPPAPPHFIAGKKLRWEGTHLMEYTGGGDQALYRFDEANKAGYETVIDGVANRVTVRVFVDPVPRYAFEFHADAYGDGRQGCGFRAGYGYEYCAMNIYEHNVRFRNRVEALRAVLGGRTVEFEDALIPTSSSSSSWGQIKQSLFSHTIVERSDR